MLARGSSRLPTALRRSYNTSSLVLPVHNTLHRFFHILDGVDPDAKLSSLFADGATLEISKANAVLSGEEIDAWCAKMRDAWAGAATLHVESNVFLTETDDPFNKIVTNRSTWTATIDGKTTAYGTHADVLEMCDVSRALRAGLDGDWKFRKRVVHHLWEA